MRALLQRVSRASVAVEGETVGAVGQGLMILLGVRQGDGEAEVAFLARKATELRIFTDENDKMNLSLLDIDGGALVVSQFTLCADCKKGRRPAFTDAERPERAEALYRSFVELLRQAGVKQVETGRFGEHMEVSLCNDGPVTILLDTDEIMPKQ